MSNNRPTGTITITGFEINASPITNSDEFEERAKKIRESIQVIAAQLEAGFNESDTADQHLLTAANQLKERFNSELAALKTIAQTLSMPDIWEAPFNLLEGKLNKLIDTYNTQAQAALSAEMAQFLSFIGTEYELQSPAPSAAAETIATVPQAEQENVTSSNELEDPLSQSGSELLANLIKMIQALPLTPSKDQMIQFASGMEILKASINHSISKKTEVNEDAYTEIFAYLLPNDMDLHSVSFKLSALAALRDIRELTFQGSDDPKEILQSINTLLSKDKSILLLIDSTNLLNTIQELTINTSIHPAKALEQIRALTFDSPGIFGHTSTSLAAAIKIPQLRQAATAAVKSEKEIRDLVMEQLAEFNTLVKQIQGEEHGIDETTLASFITPINENQPNQAILTQIGDKIALFIRNDQFKSLSRNSGAIKDKYIKLRDELDVVGEAVKEQNAFNDALKARKLAREQAKTFLQSEAQHVDAIKKHIQTISADLQKFISDPTEDSDKNSSPIAQINKEQAILHAIEAAIEKNNLRELPAITELLAQAKEKLKESTLFIINHFKKQLSKNLISYDNIEQIKSEFLAFKAQNTLNIPIDQLNELEKLIGMAINTVAHQSAEAKLAAGIKQCYDIVTKDNLTFDAQGIATVHFSSDSKMISQELRSNFPNQLKNGITIFLYKDGVLQTNPPIFYMLQQKMKSLYQAAGQLYPAENDASLQSIVKNIMTHPALSGLNKKQRAEKINKLASIAMRRMIQETLKELFSQADSQSDFTEFTKNLLQQSEHARSSTASLLTFNESTHFFSYDEGADVPAHNRGLGTECANLSWTCDGEYTPDGTRFTTTSSVVKHASLPPIDSFKKSTDKEFDIFIKTYENLLSVIKKQAEILLHGGAKTPLTIDFNYSLLTTNLFGSERQDQAYIYIKRAIQALDGADLTMDIEHHGSIQVKAQASVMNMGINKMTAGEQLDPIGLLKNKQRTRERENRKAYLRLTSAVDALQLPPLSALANWQAAKQALRFNGLKDTAQQEGYAACQERIKAATEKLHQLYMEYQKSNTDSTLRDQINAQRKIIKSENHQLNQFHKLIESSHKKIWDAHKNQVLAVLKSPEQLKRFSQTDAEMTMLTIAALKIHLDDLYYSGKYKANPELSAIFHSYQMTLERLIGMSRSTGCKSANDRTYVQRVMLAVIAGEHLPPAPSDITSSRTNHNAETARIRFEESFSKHAMSHTAVHSCIADTSGGTPKVSSKFSLLKNTFANLMGSFGKFAPHKMLKETSQYTQVKKPTKKGFFRRLLDFFFGKEKAAPVITSSSQKPMASVAKPVKRESYMASKSTQVKSTDTLRIHKLTGSQPGKHESLFNEAILQTAPALKLDKIVMDLAGLEKSGEKDLQKKVMAYHTSKGDLQSLIDMLANHKNEENGVIHSQASNVLTTVENRIKELQATLDSYPGTSPTYHTRRTLK